MVTVPRDAPPWAQTLADDVTRELSATAGSRGVRARGFPTVLARFPVADLPLASRWAGSWIYVSNEVGGAVPAYSDGTNWKRCTDGAVVS
jgi:hypothetical protein